MLTNPNKHRVNYNKAADNQRLCCVYTVLCLKFTQGLYWVFSGKSVPFLSPFIFQMIVLSDIENKSHTLRTCANKKPPMRHASKAQIVHLSKFHVP